MPYRWHFGNVVGFFYAFPLNVQNVVTALTAIAWDVRELVVHCYMKD